MFKRLKDKNDKMWAKFHNPATKIARHGKWYAIAPVTLILIGALLLVIPGVGFNLGLDFTGGSVIEARNVTTDENVINETRDAVSAFLASHNVTHNIMVTDAVGGSWGISVQFQYRSGVGMGGLDCAISSGISDIVHDHTGARPETTESISASASADRILMTFIAISVSLIAILIYILFRFKFTSGVAAIIGLLHDVLVATALMLIFRVQINYTFVAALITVVVYSLNNTIVQFDRIRSKEKQINALGGKYDVEHIVDSSIKEVFARTMSTTITTLVPVIALIALPIPLIREFALPILFGLIAGTFSTIFVTSVLYVRFEKYRMRRNAYKKKLSRAENLVSAD